MTTREGMLTAPSHSLNSKGRNPLVHSGFPGKFESSKLSRDHVSKEIGRNK